MATMLRKESLVRGTITLSRANLIKALIRWGINQLQVVLYSLSECRGAR